MLAAKVVTQEEDETMSQGRSLDTRADASTFWNMKHDLQEISYAVSITWQQAVVKLR
jgi:hypothetical protein